MLTEIEVRKIALPILRQELATEGFADVKVMFELDFDEEPIIRIQADLEKPTRSFAKLEASADAIRDALSKKGDDRFVFLRQASPALDALEFEQDENSEGAFGTFKP